MHKFYYELTKYCNERDRIVNNIRSYKRSIDLIEERLLNDNNAIYSNHYHNLRLEYIDNVNNNVNDLKNNISVITSHLWREPIQVTEKSKEELDRMNCILKRAKEIMPQDVLIYY